MPRPRLPGPIAVLDIETTGLNPRRHDRVVEVGAVLIDDHGKIVREFSSLVNPGRDLGPTSIHGLTGEDLLHAPQFHEIAGIMVETLNGAIALAGHNIRFDLLFLDHEFARIGVQFPNCYTLCTLALAGGERLVDCCNTFGISLDGVPHHALTDARAAAQLLTVLLSMFPDKVQELAQQSPIEWPPIETTEKRPVTRDDVRCRQAEHPSYLQRLQQRLALCSTTGFATEGAVMAYAALIDRALEDRYIDENEAELLLATATESGITAEQARCVHDAYFDQLVIAAVSDGIVTDIERRDLERVARLLGINKGNLEDLLRDASRRVQGATPVSHALTRRAEVVGKTVCFTGESRCYYNGELITRDIAEKLATEAGLVVKSSVTKGLDILVVADPCSQSRKARKAREYGVSILHEVVFWKKLGVEVA